VEVAVPDPDDRERRDRDEEGLSNLAESYRKGAPYMAASTQLVGAVAIFSLVGWKLDEWLGHRTPWLLLVGALVGMIGGFLSFFRTVLGKTKDK
jgi:F0F1-type ATP synthase assembly protein I